MKEIRTIFNDLKDGQQQVLGYDYPDNLKTVFLDYQKVWKGEDYPEDTEQRFDIPMGKLNGEKVMFVGVIDEVYGGGKIVGEHKTFSRAPKVSFMIMNPQGCLYSKAVQLLYGILPDKIKWDFIKSDIAKTPVFLEKSNRLSEAQNQGITSYSWLRACKEHDITDEKVLAVADKYKPNTSNFFFRYMLDTEPTMVEKTWEDFRDTARIIVKQGHKDQKQIITRDCGWCNYYDICYGEFTGADINYLKEKNYTKKEEVEEDEEHVEDSNN